MKNILRNAALAVSVLSIGASVARPVSGQLAGIKNVNAVPWPSCPPGVENGCGIYRPALGSVSTPDSSR